MRWAHNEQLRKAPSSPISSALRAIICVPRATTGMVIIARGAEAARQPGLYHQLAEGLRCQGLGTCLLDLVDSIPDKPPTRLINTAAMMDRLHLGVQFLQRQSQTTGLPLALVGMDLSANVALRFAATNPLALHAVVSWCGRGWIGNRWIPRIKTPTLLLTPGREQRLVATNNRLFAELDCSSQLAVVRGATRTFGEPGAMMAAQMVAGEWCQQFLDLAYRQPCRSRCGKH